MNCSTIGCREIAVAVVPGYPDPLPECFTHEREYVDRYGHEGVSPLGAAGSAEGNLEAPGAGSTPAASTTIQEGATR